IFISSAPGVSSGAFFLFSLQMIFVKQSNSHNDKQVLTKFYAISQLSIDVSSTIQNTITMMYINRMDSKNDQIFLRSIFKDCIDQANPSILVRDMFNLDLNILSWRSNTLDLDHFNHIWVFGAGKAAASMAHGLFEVLKNRIEGGIV